MDSPIQVHDGQDPTRYTVPRVEDARLVRTPSHATVVVDPLEPGGGQLVDYREVGRVASGTRLTKENVQEVIARAITLAGSAEKAAEAPLPASKPSRSRPRKASRPLPAAIAGPTPSPAQPLTDEEQAQITQDYLSRVGLGHLGPLPGEASVEVVFSMEGFGSIRVYCHRVIRGNLAITIWNNTQDRAMQYVPPANPERTFRLLVPSMNLDVPVAFIGQTAVDRYIDVLILLVVPDEQPQHPLDESTSHLREGEGWDLQTP